MAASLAWRGCVAKLASHRATRDNGRGGSAADIAARQPGQGRKAAATTDFAWVVVRSPTLRLQPGCRANMGLFDDDEIPPPSAPSLFGDEPVVQEAPKAAAYRVL